MAIHIERGVFAYFDREGVTITVQPSAATQQVVLTWKEAREVAEAILRKVQA